MNPIVILGSSRSNGETFKAVKNTFNESVPIVDLSTYAISFYDYEHRNQNDEFLPLMKRIVGHDTIVLATPVYWYTMSAQMKVFVDRFSDLLRVGKETGRKLRGKKLYVITTFSTSMPKGFEDAFSQTCEYLGMQYLGCSYIYSGDAEGLKQNNALEIEKAQRLIFQ